MNKRLLFIAGATTLLSAAVVVTSFFATNRNFASTNAGPYIDPDPDPIEVVTVTPTTLTYTFNDFARDRWAESPNGNLIGIHVGGNYALSGGGVLLEKDEGGYITTTGVSTNPSAKKYAFSEIMNITVYFSGSLNVTTPSGTEALSNGVEKNLYSASSFRIDPVSSSSVVTSIKVTYNSTASFCN